MKMHFLRSSQPVCFWQLNTLTHSTDTMLSCYLAYWWGMLQFWIKVIRLISLSRIGKSQNVWWKMNWQCEVSTAYYIPWKCGVQSLFRCDLPHSLDRSQSWQFLRRQIYQYVSFHPSPVRIFLTDHTLNRVHQCKYQAAEGGCRTMERHLQNCLRTWSQYF